ncbi:MAG: acetylesterase [Pedosphaera sp.]|nr:acetylesterase [Pedosphaera sp.]
MTQKTKLMKTSLFSLALVALLATPPPVLAAGKGQPLNLPDFTKGGTIPAGAKHDWNLGPTGLRGWMFCDKMVTTDARQISVTTVEKGSPSEGILAVGDVILGVGGKAFSYDPRTEFGKALTTAESEAGGGRLELTRWRAGKSEGVVVKLPVLGNYSVTAPFDCPKSKRILEQGCEALAEKVAKSPQNEDPIVRSFNALALLASANPAYLPLIKKEAEWAAGFSSDSMQTWHYGYVIMLLSEYVLATGDRSVMPGLRRLALEAAKGQSAVGSWGHGFAVADGRLGGYGMMNSPGLPLTISLVMAWAAGVEDPEVARAIELSARLLRFYIGKGAIPYGDHHPWIENHDDNGKCGMAAVLFNLLGETKGAEFFSRMSIASHGPERDTGHTGNFFNILWSIPGVAQSGPNATGAWMQEFGAWYFDLARRWDGSFLHQGPPELDDDSYAGWDCTGGYLLAYAMPLRKIYLTGKRPSTAPQLDAAAAHALILDGRGWSNKDRNSAYDKLSEDQLFERLDSWSPVVRERAAMALARRKEVPFAPLLIRLDSPRLESRYGACQALIALRGRGAPAVDALRKSLATKDLWVRIKAAEALASIGAPATRTVPELLELLAPIDKENDPRGMQQRYLSFALFDDGGMLNRSLDGVDREALYKAVRGGLENQDGRARGSMGSVYRNLSPEDIKPLLPAIYKAIIEPAPSGEMFADSIRVKGLRLLAKYRIEEGIGACVKYTRDQNPWGSQERTPELMKILLTYGAHAKSVIPELTKIADYFEKDEKDFPKELMLMKAKCVRETIRAIQVSTESLELIHLK